MNKPNFFIVGAPKCGTTAMDSYLAQHPEIFMAPKELHYFGNDLKVKVRLSESEYLQYFQDAKGKKIIGESSVWYLFSKTAATEIKMFSPGARILIMLRNPVDVIYSLHSQNLYDGNEDITDAETAINLDEQRKKGINLPDAVDFYELPPYKEAGLFFEQVKRYIEVFGKENVHIVTYENFLADNNKTVKEVFQFLNVNMNTEINYKIVNSNKRIKSFYLHRLIKKSPEKLKRMARVILPVKKLRHKVMKSILDRNTSEGKREVITNSKFDKELKNFFQEDIKSLSKLIGRDLSSWLQ